MTANGDPGCFDATTFDLVPDGRGVPDIDRIETQDWSWDNNTITVHMAGNGNYEYSLDGILFQDARTFTGLPPGGHTVHARIRNGCETATETVYLLHYPNFFTPNGDNINDSWQLINSANEPGNKIFIFDRYGKLLKQLDPLHSGWDGNYQGTPMPASDYWFLVQRQNGERHQGHFSLVR